MDMSEVQQQSPTELLGSGGAQAPLLPLQLHMESCATQEEMNSQVRATMKRGYVRINEYLDKFPGAVSVCGAGPSLRKRWQELGPLGADILACNSAIGFLLERGVVPKFGMIWDAHPICENFAVPHPDVTYLIGARCHESVFARLQGCKVIVWHAGGDHNIAQLLMDERVNEPMINGGSAAVTRGMYLAVALGKRVINVFGADSSYDEDGATHVRGASLVPEKDLLVSVGNDAGSKTFRTTPEWCAQIEEFKMIYGHFRRIGIPIHSYCDGMWQNISELLQLIHNYPLGAQPIPQQINGQIEPDGSFSLMQTPMIPAATHLPISQPSQQEIANACV